MKVYQLILKHPSDSFIDRKMQSLKEKQGAVFFWNNMGRLTFKLTKSYKTFFNGMPDKDADEVIRILNKAIQKQT